MLYISFNYTELHRLKEAVFAPHMVNAGQYEQEEATLVALETDLPPGTSPLSKLDLGPFEVHSMV